MSSLGSREHRLRRIEARGGTGLIIFLIEGATPHRLGNGSTIAALREELGRRETRLPPDVVQRLSDQLAVYDKRSPRNRSFAIITEADYAMA